jgi:hypothetical protein
MRSDAMSNVEPSAFIAGMKDTVESMKALCSAIDGAPDRHGHLPSPSLCVAMSDLAAEAKFANRFGEDWTAPVRDTHTFGGMTILAATDYGHCYAEMFAGNRAPVFGHLVVARAALEACVISAWLNDPTVETEERIKRGLCELFYSTWEVNRLEIDVEGAAANEAAYRRIASRFEWEVRNNRGKPVVDGTQRPSIAASIAQMVLADNTRPLGKVQWSYLSSVVHSTWWGIRQAVVEGPRDSGLGPSVAMIGTESRAVNNQSLCLLRALRYAGTARLTTMGWLDDVWRDAAQRSEAHESALLKWIVTTLPEGMSAKQ